MSAKTRSVRSLAHQRAFDEFFVTNYRMLVVHAFKRGVTFTEAEDVVSAAMFDVDRKWGELDNPIAYARKAVWSHICLLFRDRDRDVEPLPSDECHDYLPAVDDTAMTQLEIEQWLLSKLHVLTPAMLQVIQGMFFDEMTTSEMSDQFDKTEAAIRKQIQLARTRLRKEWALHQSENESRNGSGETDERRP